MLRQIYSDINNRFFTQNIFLKSFYSVMYMCEMVWNDFNLIYQTNEQDHIRKAKLIKGLFGKKQM